MKPRRTVLATLFAFCGIITLGQAVLYEAARAADASPWFEDSLSSMRLIAGSRDGNEPHLRAGIELKLHPGWKTYWRYPGDSGVPPRFDFSGSDNLLRAKVSYPAPHLFTDETGNSIGYKQSVIFPVQVTPRDASKPVRLKLKLDYAVCEKLCMPVEGHADLVLTPGDSTNEQALADAEAKVPKLVSAAEAGLSARRVTQTAKPLVDVDLPATGKPITLFVEGPSADWALPVPTPAQGAPAGRLHFGFELDGLPPGVDPKAAFDLTYTIVEGDRAVEVTSHLD
jgi:DsbC/DsbD-like thiol-disulfide interchange protein